MGRAFADHVDGARRITCAGGQTGGSAHDFNAVVDDGVSIRLHKAEGVEHPVNLEVTNGIATGGIGDPVRVVVLHYHAGGMAHGLGKGVEVEVVHLLAGDDRDRLRGFANAQVEFGRGAGRARGVGTTVFGGCTQAFGSDTGTAQLQRTGGFFGVIQFGICQ